MNVCRCEPPMRDGDDCSKCGRPLRAFETYVKPPSSASELERRRKIREYARARKLRLRAERAAAKRAS